MINLPIRLAHLDHRMLHINHALSLVGDKDRHIGPQCMADGAALSDDMTISIEIIWFETNTVFSNETENRPIDPKFIANLAMAPDICRIPYEHMPEAINYHAQHVSCGE